jgi:lipid-binding SYLF domain-containing protein
MGLIALALGGAAVFAAEPAGQERAEKRAEIDAAEQQTLDRLFRESPRAKKLFDTSYGHAVFTSLKVAVGISGGGGHGVAVSHAADQRIYMRMGSVGVGLGLGGRKYRVVFLFEDQKTFDRFVDKGWQADTSASAAAGTESAGVSSTFSDGVAIFQLTDKGLMAQAEIAGTKYWKSEKLN